MAMLAEMYLLNLENKLRANPNEAPRVVSTSPFVRYDMKKTTVTRTASTK
jgi:hypothetical protein